MAFEIDYIPVGEGERSGDAIAIRYGNFVNEPKEQTVIVIDGGFKDSGAKLVEHIKTIYGTDKINLVISTHPDMDHASGLSVVLEEMEVGGLLMHKPWDHAVDIKNFFKSKSITTSSLKEKIEKSLQNVSDLEDLANKKGIKIYEPFEGMNLSDTIHILGPSELYYESLLPHFRSTPEAKTTLGVLNPLKNIAKDTVSWIEDHLHIDILNDDEDTTSPENNTSTIILFTIDEKKILFTGDAGKTALLNAIEYAKNKGISLNDLWLLDVPHHGSKRNLSSRILNNIKAENAFVSASGNSPKHPAKKITNAFHKHGTNIRVARGEEWLYHQGGNQRGWYDGGALEPFHGLVEE